MKLTTSAAVAAAASTAVAQDTWNAWSSSSAPVKAISSEAPKSCPAPVTEVKTVSTTAYEVTKEVFKSTITVPVPEKSPEPLSIEPNWVKWESSSSAGASDAKTCKPGQTVTSTSTVTSKLPGTTTVTRSILYVGAQVTGSPEGAWDNWKPSDAGSGSGSQVAQSGSGSGSPSKPGSQGNVGGQGSSGSGSASGSGSGQQNGLNGKDGWGKGSWGGSGTGGLQLGSGEEVFHWEAPVPSNTASGIAPVYTKGPNGWSGTPIAGIVGEVGGVINGLVNGVAGEVGDIIGGAAGDVGDIVGGVAGEVGGVVGGIVGGLLGGGSSSSSSKGGPAKTNSTGTFNNSGSVASNSSAALNATGQIAWGSEASNVTAAFLPLKDSKCNSANDRSQWCNGLSISTDYYKNYWATNSIKARTLPLVGDMLQEGSSIVGDVVATAGQVVNSVLNSAGAGAGSGPSGGNCNYDLTLSRGLWNYDGEDREMILVNGQFPGPAIECNWGDLVSINVHNNIADNGTAIHWHGIRQVDTNSQDGVPGVTECAIAPGTSKTYTWRASSYGTSWYHSHWNLQYADGVQGPIVIHGPATADYDVDAGPVMITDTYGKLSGSAFGDLTAHQGPLPTENYLLNGKNVKADLSSGQHAIWKVQKGKKYLFRLINSAAQNMYSVSIDQHKMTVIAGDFVPVKPYTTEWVSIGIGQRYDVVVEMDQDVDTYFFRAVTQTLCPSSSINSGLGQANGIIAYEGVQEFPVPLPTSTLNGDRTPESFRICQDEPLSSLVPAFPMSAGSASKFSEVSSTVEGGTVTKVQTSDEGAVYRWFLNNGAMYVNYTQPTLMSLEQGLATANSTQYANQITLHSKNQWVYFVIQNQFFAFHPMHLHGHDFSILGQGDGVFDASNTASLNFDNPMRRDTAMLAGASSPGSTGGYTVIGFETDNPGAWLMHCHIAWHIDGGLGLQWIERPDDIPRYASESDFKEECAAYGSYEDQSPAYEKLSGQSGLRRRDLFFDRMSAAAKRTMSSVVRRNEHAAHYLDAHKKRSLGDGSAKRAFGRH